MFSATVKLGQHDLLIDRADSVVLRFLRRFEVDRLPMQRDQAGVFLVDSGNDFVGVDFPAPFSPMRA